MEKQVCNQEHIQHRTKLKIPQSQCQLPDRRAVSPVESDWYRHIVAVGPLAAVGQIAALK